MSGDVPEPCPTCSQEHVPSPGTRDEEVAVLTIDDFAVGDSFSLRRVISEQDVDRFASVSGDYGPLHMDRSFAQERGFKDRVVHGFFLGSLVSCVVGMHFPGRFAMLQTERLQFVAPAYIGDTVEATLSVDQVSPGTQTVVMRVRIENVESQKLLVRGKVQVGLTDS